ncbi:MAG: GTP-binding protein, partial [Oscillospiraceae bacterium]|nr:GTP-binding protein [Oscillospiraceae bacterium]
ILPPIVVLSPESLDANMSGFGDICRDQIENAGIVVFSKCEHSSPELISDAAEKIRAVNPNAAILLEHYSRMPAEWWNSLLLGEGEETISVTEDDSAQSDDMMQVTFSHGSLANPAELIVLLEDVLRYEFGNIPRAKGVIKAGDEWLRFSLADGRYDITSEPETAETRTQCVFIGKAIDKKHLSGRFDSMKA